MSNSSGNSHHNGNPAKYDEKRGDDHQLRHSASLSQLPHLNPKDLDIVTSSTKVPIRMNNRHFESTTNIGLPPTQEDRLVMVPRLFLEDLSFCGVFDGTVGHHASDFLMSNIIDHLCSTQEMKEIVHHTSSMGSEVYSMANYEQMANSIRDAMQKSFLNVDQALIRMCEEHSLHYASSTGVAALIWKNLLTIAHIGDSKACIAKVSKGVIQPEWLTIDHKPNMPHELKRIQESGGSLAWLHGNKPYIRGGDFLRRQANGEHPKQLNYSRAFGGKDLKMFGLIADPDINHFEINEEDKLILIASDGLWDVLSPKFACELAIHARKNGRSATNEIVQRAIKEMPNCGVADNITVVAIFLNDI